MRSTLEIIIAVKEQQLVTAEELKMALLTLSSVNYFYQKALKDIAEAKNDDKKVWLEFKIKDGIKLIDRMIKAQKEDPIKWLGQDNIPGTPEYNRFHKMCMNILKKAEKEIGEKNG